MTIQIMSSFSQLNYPFLGYGVGLRAPYFQEILKTQPKNVDWFEVVTGNFLLDGGISLSVLEQIRKLYPCVLHGTGLSLGSVDELNIDYLTRLKSLAKHIEPAWISEHLCWSSFEQTYLHDLLPLPYTEEAINHVVARIQYVQEFLGQRILIENVSSYITYKHNEMTEWEFLSEIANRADCLILLDINNIYVSAYNHHFNPLDYLNGVPANRVQQFHLAGHSHCGDYIIDTHDNEIISDVWHLYEKAIQSFGNISLLIERDDSFPALSELFADLERARSIATQELKQHEIA